MKAENRNVKETAKSAAKNASTAAKTAATAAKSAARNAKTVEKAVEKSVEKTAASLEKAAEKTMKAAEKAVKEKPIRKSAVKETVYLQYLGKEINTEDLVKKVKEIWTGEMNRKSSEMKSVTLYLKPEENAAYYVVNGEVTGKIAL